MNHDKQLRKTFDEASVADLVPGFDPDAGWQEVCKGLKPVRKRIPLSRYLPYAAAIAAVLLLLVRQKEDTSLTLVAFRSVVVKMPQPEQHPGQLAPLPDHPQLATRPVHHAATPHTAPASTSAPLPEDTAKMPLAAAATVSPAASLPVRHYADIAPVQPAAEEQHIAGGQKKGFWRSRIARRRIAPQTGTKEEAPIRGLMYALNKE